MSVENTKKILAENEVKRISCAFTDIKEIFQIN